MDKAKKGKAASEFKYSDPWDYKAPSGAPQLLELPDRLFVWLDGAGDPNGREFEQAMGTLYSFSYAVRMSYRSPEPPEGARAYVVGVLQGQWDIVKGSGGFDPRHKEKLAWRVMIRQPDFLDEPLFERFRDQAREKALKKKEIGPEWFDALGYGMADSGKYAQILHTGPYDAEPATFARMESSLAESGLKRSSMAHREIYLGDPRRTAPEKLKTILRVTLS